MIQQANLLTIALHYNCKNQFLSIVFVEIEFSLIDKWAMCLSLAYFFLSFRNTKVTFEVLLICHAPGELKQRNSMLVCLRLLGLKYAKMIPNL